MVNVFITALPGEIEQQQQESRKPAPMEYKLLREIDEKFSNPAGAQKLRMLREVVYRHLPAQVKPYKARLNEILDVPSLKPLDVVISSFGKHPFELKRSANESGSPKHVGGVMTRALQESKPMKFDGDNNTVSSENASTSEPYYRKWIGT